MSKKETRRIYCDEEELAYAKHCIQQRRAGLALQNTDSAPNGSLDSAPNGSLDKLDQILDYISDLNSEVYTLRSYTIPQLEQKISALTHKIEQLSGQSY